MLLNSVYLVNSDDDDWQVLFFSWILLFYEKELQLNLFSLLTSTRIAKLSAKRNFVITFNMPIRLKTYFRALVLLVLFCVFTFVAPKCPGGEHDSIDIFTGRSEFSVCYLQLGESRSGVCAMACYRKWITACMNRQSSCIDSSVV